MVRRDCSEMSGHWPLFARSTWKICTFGLCVRLRTSRSFYPILAELNTDPCIGYNRFLAFKDQSWLINNWMPNVIISVVAHVFETMAGFVHRSSFFRLYYIELGALVAPRADAESCSLSVDFVLLEPCAPGKCTCETVRRKTELLAVYCDCRVVGVWSFFFRAPKF